METNVKESRSFSDDEVKFVVENPHWKPKKIADELGRSVKSIYDLRYKLKKTGSIPNGVSSNGKGEVKFKRAGAWNKYNNPINSEELRFIMDNPDMPARELARKLGRSAQAIYVFRKKSSNRKTLSSVKSKSAKNRRFTEDEIKFVAENMNMRAQDIADKFGAKVAAIYELKYRIRHGKVINAPYPVAAARKSKPAKSVTRKKKYARLTDEQIAFAIENKDKGYKWVAKKLKCNKYGVRSLLRRHEKGKLNIGMPSKKWKKKIAAPVSHKVDERLRIVMKKIKNTPSQEHEHKRKSVKKPRKRPEEESRRILATADEVMRVMEVINSPEMKGKKLRVAYKQLSDELNKSMYAISAMYYRYKQGVYDKILVEKPSSSGKPDVTLAEIKQTKTPEIRIVDKRKPEEMAKVNFRRIRLFWGLIDISW